MKTTSTNRLLGTWAVVLIALSVSSFAQEAGPVTQPTDSQQQADGTGTPASGSTNNQTGGASSSLGVTAADLKQVGFGAGVAVIFMSKQGIENASVDGNGIIRVEELSQARAGAILEYHFYWADRRKPRLTAEEVRTGKVKAEGEPKGLTNQTIEVGSPPRWDLVHGPAFAVEFGDNVIRSAGIGYQWSWRDYSFATENGKRVLKTEGSPFNLGLFVLVEPDVKVLGDGLEANQPLPAGDALRFEKEAHIGGALVLSYSF
jgi:hypothetical protein